MTEIVEMTAAEMRSRIARWGEQTPNTEMMITQRIPGHARDMYTIIGRGVAEDAGVKPAIEDSTGFNVTYVGAAPNNGSAMHTHAEVEVFIPFSGTWSVYWNEDEGKRAEAILGPMDCISVPPGVMRAFRNVGEDYGHLMVIIAGTENATVDRPDRVKAEAAAQGLKLDETGRMVAAEAD